MYPASGCWVVSNQAVTLKMLKKLLSTRSCLKHNEAGVIRYKHGGSRKSSFTEYVS